MLRGRAKSLGKLSLSGLWHGRSVRTHILFAIVVINLLAALVAGAVSIINTRVATRLEIQSSLEVAQRLVDARVRDLAAQGRLNELDDRLPNDLKHLRHVRIMLVDSFGNLTVVSRPPDTVNGKPVSNWVPAWFKALVGPKLAQRAVLAGSANGSLPVIIVGDPVDELAEAWREFSTLILVWLVLNAFILLALYAILSRVLDPLVSLSRGLLNLEDGDYATRLDPPKEKEIAVITNRFNALAGALGTARDENSRLYQQLILVQEQERREIANELHDEAGPCLFGIAANAASIKTIAERLPDPRTEIPQRVDDILSIAERLKLMNRALLNRLKPGSLGRVGVAELVTELIAGFHARHPDIRIVASVGRLAQSYGEAIDLTLYRCIQEGITNALRHGGGRRITVDLTERHLPGRKSVKRSRLALCLILRDDGKGFDASLPKGFGLNSMTERVRSHGGTCAIESVPAKGTTIRIEIPAQRGTAERARRLELA